MRKSIFMAAVLLVSAFGFAQPKMNVVGLSGIDVQAKRCVVNGNNCYFDFLLTNENAKDMAELYIGGLLSSDAGYLYDDEGNIYKYANGLERLTLGTNSSSYSVTEKMPRGVSIKFRIEFNNIDEYATVFKLLKIPAFINGGEQGYIELRNVPIVRRDQ